MEPLGRALVVRIGALGDVVLTRRLSYSLWLAGFRTTLFAPARHASLLAADSWVDGVLDSESPEWARVFGGEWPEWAGRFEVAAVVSLSADLARAAESAADRVVQISNWPLSQSKGPSAAHQWAEAAADVAEPFTGLLPDLPTEAARSRALGATLIHPGSGSPRKNWPVGRFIELGRALKASGHLVLWIRGPAEAAESAEPGAGAAESVAGSEFEIIDRPPLDVLAATLAQARVFIGNDSGVSHLAGAVGAPTVALFGPTDPAIWRPDGRRVRTVRAESGDLADISVDAVLAAVADAIGVANSRVLL